MPLVTAAESATARCHAGGRFEDVLRRAVEEHKPRRILETGTHDGTGTTRMLADACAAFSPGALIVSIEADPALARVAQANRPDVAVFQGLSLPREMLPTVEIVAADLARLDAAEQDIVADYPAESRAEHYVGETDKPGADDLIGAVLGCEWRGCCDLILLDSAGHLGWREFAYVTALLQSPCLILLDDVRHVKHWRSLRRAKADTRRFRVLEDVPDERFGFALVHYCP